MNHEHKFAVDAAIKYFDEVKPREQSLKGLRLEQIKGGTPDYEDYKVILSFEENGLFHTERTYKTFYVTKEYKVESMEFYRSENN